MGAAQKMLYICKFHSYMLNCIELKTRKTCGFGLAYFLKNKIKTRTLNEYHVTQP